MQVVEELRKPLVDAERQVGGPVEIKIAYIGGGSREWAVKLMSDLALSAHLTGKLSLYDIDMDAAERNASMSNSIFSHRKALSKFEVEAEHNLDAALQGADFVVISIEPGHIERRYADLEIPAKYGVLQTVGDTTGPGGIMRALRIAPTYEHLAHRIVEICPKAWVINYTNPMALCVRILLEAEPRLKVFGCCHEVFGTQDYLADLATKWLSIERPSREEIELEIAGVNHFTFATRAQYQGVDLLACLREDMNAQDYFDSRVKEAERAKLDGKWFESEHLIAARMLQKYGALGAAGDRHLVEFLPGYLSSEAELHRWGVIVTPFSWRLERWKKSHDNPDQMLQDDLKPSGEEGVQQIEALLGIKPYVTNVNLPNRGQMVGGGEGTIVETYAFISRDRITPLVGPALPCALDGLVQRAISEQDLTMRSIRTRNYSYALQALMLHPLVSKPPEIVEGMFREMVDYNKDMLTDFSFE